MSGNVEPEWLTTLLLSLDDKAKYATHVPGGNFLDIREWGRYRATLSNMALNRDHESFNKLNIWRKTMAHRVFTIELKMDMDPTDAGYEPMKHVVAIKAMELQASAMLLAGGNKKPPEIVMFTEDQFFTVEDIVPISEDDMSGGMSEVTEGGNTDAA